MTTLSTWEQCLLKHIKATSTSYGSRKTHIELGDKLWIVTDRGLKRGDRYYGWVIAADTNILWEGRGYVQSNAELVESLHMEGMTHLAAATILKHYNWYYNTPIKPHKAKHFTDNQGIVKQINWFQTRCIKTLSDCLAPDYDIQSQTEAICKEMDWDWETAWVKGHQDKAIHHEELKWEEKLNV
eukprot:15160146-Ditylum_brightwellii.AAC.2